MAERLTGEPREIAVHPNSMAAKKWKRTTWRTNRNLFAEAAQADKHGQHERARALRRTAARAGATDMHCG